MYLIPIKRKSLPISKTNSKRCKNAYTKLRKSVVHNDANDNNIIVTESLTSPKVKAIIDYGDAIYTQTINDVAITCAYAIMKPK